MLVTIRQPEAPAVIRTDFHAIFVSLELSQSKWLVTSLSPSGGARTSKHVMEAGDVSGLLVRLAEFKHKAKARTGICFPLIVIRKPGSMASGSTVCWKRKGSKAMSPIRPRLPHRAGGGGRRPTGLTARRSCAPCLPIKRGELRVCAMVRVPTPAEEDRRRLSRERKVLMKEKVRHINRIKGLLFGQGISGYEPVKRDRRKALEMLATGDPHRPRPETLSDGKGGLDIGRHTEALRPYSVALARATTSSTSENFRSGRTGPNCSS
jgi:transposase